MRLIVITGSVPSLKNNKQIFYNSKTKRPFITSSQASKQWVEDALWQLKGKEAVTNYPATVNLSFYVKDNRSRDLDNMCSSVMDVLQEAKIIANDDWQRCNPITLRVEGIDKDNPRVEISII